MPERRRLPTLVFYRDPAQLCALDRRGLCGVPLGLAIELGDRSRLRPAGPAARIEVGLEGPEVGPHCATPMVWAPDGPRSHEAAAWWLRRQLGRVRGAAALVCHVDDAAGVVGRLPAVDDVRLVWHPADAAGEAVTALVGRLDGTAAGQRLGLDPVYFSTVGREVSMDDWRQALDCPALGALRALGRSRPRQAALDRVLAAWGT